MCTNPLKIVNPSKWLSPSAGQQLYIRVPCGHCLECRQLLQNEWRIRTYYECLDTIQSGGYVLFDTLTYSDLFLPRLSDYIAVPHELDFSCFRSKDITDFLKRLRTYLSRKHYDVNNSLRYFVVSEYGTSDKGTKRPHYHVFFFVRHNCVPADVLSASISHCWHNGRTDGLPFKTRGYVFGHNRFDRMDVATKRCIMYVSKYVAKDFLYSNLVVDRLNRLMDYYYGDAYGNAVMSDSARSFLRQLRTFVNPFHRQSLGFGMSYLDMQCVDHILETGKLVFNFNGIPFVCALFPSTKRKLFYNYRKNDVGDVQWYINNRGIEFKVSQYDNNVSKLQSQIDEYNLCHDVKLTFDPGNYYLNQYRLVPDFITRDRYKDVIVSSSSVYCYNGLRNYASIDKGLLGKYNPVFSKSDFGSKKHGFSLFNVFRFVYDVINMDNLSSCDVIRLEDFEKYCYFDQNAESQVDALYAYYKQKGESALSARKKIENNKQKLKNVVYV